MTCRLQGRQGDGPSGTTSKPGDTEVPVTTPGESPAPGTAWPKMYEAAPPPVSRREWEAQYLQQPAQPNVEELIDRVCRGVGSNQEGQQLREYIRNLQERDQPRAATHFTFLWQRPKDKEPWGVIYSDRQRAENCEFRVSLVRPVRLERFFPERTDQGDSGAVMPGDTL